MNLAKRCWSFSWYLATQQGCNPSNRRGVDFHFAYGLSGLVNRWEHPIGLAIDPRYIYFKRSHFWFLYELSC